MNIQDPSFFDGLIERINQEFENKFKARLWVILSERKRFFSERNECRPPSKYEQGWDDCLKELKKRTGLDESPK